MCVDWQEAAVNKVVLVQSGSAEIDERVQALRGAGFEVDAFINTKDGAVGLLKWLKDVPAAFLIDLDRSPSVGRAKGMWLRQRANTRRVPLIFAGGAPEKVEEVRSYLPDAVFTGWDHAVRAVREAIAAPPADPVVPDTMAPYKGRSLAGKLGLRVGTAVVLTGAPDGFEARLGPLPDGVAFTRSPRAMGRMGMLFVESLGDLERRLGKADGAVAKNGALWVIWPKQSSGRGSDLTQAKVRKHLMDRHWVDYKIASIDETWTGMVFARRDNTEWLTKRKEQATQ